MRTRKPRNDTRRPRGSRSDGARLPRNKGKRADSGVRRPNGSKFRDADLQVSEAERKQYVMDYTADRKRTTGNLVMAAGERVVAERRGDPFG